VRLLADIAELKEVRRGRRDLDDGHTTDPALPAFARALVYAGMFGMPGHRAALREDPTLKGDGVAHEGGFTAPRRLGLRGIAGAPAKRWGCRAGGMLSGSSLGWPFPRRAT
jgi:hypothetical protein